MVIEAGQREDAGSQSASRTGWAPAAGNRRAGAIVEALLTILVAAGIAGVVLLLTGHDPLAAFAELVQRTLLRSDGLEQTVVQACPILITAVAVHVAAEAGLWNIGIDGQVLAGAFAGAVTGPALGGFGIGGLALGAALAGVLAGGLWAAVPALMRSRYGLNEIVSTIMLNYVALSLTAWLVKGPFRDRSLVTPQTALIPRELRLPDLGPLDIHAGAVAALALVPLAGFVLHRTVSGFELRATGANPDAARRALVPVRRVWAGALIASGAIAALAGVNDVLATKGTFQAEWNPEYGLSAFVVVFLARRTLWGLLPASLFAGALAYGADVMPRAAGIAPAFFFLFEGLVLATLAIPALVGGRSFARLVSRLGTRR